MNARTWLGMAFCFAALVALFDFSLLGYFQTDQGDTLSYTVTARYFYDKQMPADPVLKHYVQARLLKPTYGAIGALLMPVMPPEQSMFLLNILFYSGCVYFLFRLLASYLNFKPWQAFIGVAWFACSYPMLKYGFALLTDIGGYFFALFAIYLALMADKKNKPSLLFWAGAVSAIGFATKETGGLGMLFIFFYWLLRIRQLGFKQVIKSWLAAGLPFLALSLTIQYSVIRMSGYTYADWIGGSEDIYGQKYRTLKYFVGTQSASFHLLWIFFLYGLYKIKKIANPSLLLSLIPVSLPVLVWPLFITRILFFQFIYVIPFALHGFGELIQSIQKPALKKTVTWGLAALPCLISLGLFLAARQGSLFKL